MSLQNTSNDVDGMKRSSLGLGISAPFCTSRPQDFLANSSHGKLRGDVKKLSMRHCDRRSVIAARVRGALRAYVL